jgi:hypothetical protein
MAKGNDQKRYGELESTMATKNNWRGGSQSRRTIVFCCKRSKSTPKLKLWANQSKISMAITNKGGRACCWFLVNFWNFWEKYTRNWCAISTSQRFCAQKIIQELGLDNFVHKKSYKNWYLTILSRKNHTKFCI